VGYSWFKRIIKGYWQKNDLTPESTYKWAMDYVRSENWDNYIKYVTPLVYDPESNTYILITFYEPLESEGGYNLMHSLYVKYYPK
jgi:hypothetical protein